MRVLQLHKDYEPLSGGGGTARHIHGLAKSLIGYGCEVRVVSPKPEKLDVPYEIMAGGSFSLRDHAAWADVVHVHGARSVYAVAGALTAKLAGRPFVYTPHAFYEPRGRINALVKSTWDITAEKFLLEGCASTILLTEVWREWLLSRGISSSRTTIIPNCVLGSDLIAEPRNNADALLGRPSLLTVGRLDPVKRIGDIIRAIASPDLSHAHLHIVGKGQELAALNQLVRSLEVSDRVTFHGFVDDIGVAKMVAGADIFVLASEQEGLPTVLLEAVLAGLPIVCTEIPGNLTITRAAEISDTYPVGDIDALRTKLAAIRNFQIQPSQIEMVKRQFTWEYRAVDIVQIYRDALIQYQ